MNKAEFITRTETARVEWDALLVEVGRSRMEETLPDGGSVKDVIAHITWYEREMVNLLESRDFTAGSDLWLKPPDERNIIIHEQNRERGLDDVLDDSTVITARLLGLLRGLEEANFTDASRFVGMPFDWEPGAVFAGNCYEHYEDHTAVVRAWLGEKHRN